MRVLQILFISLFSMQLVACGNVEGQNESNAEQIAINVSAEEFHQYIIEKDGQILDVRTEEELESGYIPNAIHIDFYSSNFEDKLKELDSSKPVFVYCAAGGRSGKAMNKLKSLNFTEVYNLNGGFPTWESAGYEVQK